MSGQLARSADRPTLTLVVRGRQIRGPRRLALVAAMSLLLGGCILTLPKAPSVGGRATFGCTRSPQTFVVPPGAAILQIEALGGSGGVGEGGPAAGRGIQQAVSLAVTPGEVLRIEVGCAGADGTTAAGGAGGYGGPNGSMSGGAGGLGTAPGIGPPIVCCGGGGGGGATTVQAASFAVVTAGGGGGSGARDRFASQGGTGGNGGRSE